jgi:hypothetical protein
MAARVNTDSKKDIQDQDFGQRTRSGRYIVGNEYTIKSAKQRERQELMRKLRQIRGKNDSERTKDDISLLDACKDLVEHIVRSLFLYHYSTSIFYQYCMFVI